MKELMKITDAEFALLCYIKEAARKQVKDDYHHYELSETVLYIINLMLDKHCEELK